MALGQERAGFTDSAHDPEKLRILLQVLRAMTVWGRALGGGKIHRIYSAWKILERMLALQDVE